MFVYLSKKISIPNNVQLRSIAWSSKEGYISCGGDEGLLKVLKLESSGGKDNATKGLAAPTNLSINQNLEGHSGSVQVLSWNDDHQKLTTSDENGLIIVWMMHKGSWYEEMINNRNKSVVRDMAWNSEGGKICIVYEDGVVIVGSVDGNRLWGKEIKCTLVAVEWSPSCALLLFGLSTGEVHIYDSGGDFVSKLNIVCLEHNNEGTIVEIAWHPYASGAPALAIIFQHGAIQLMNNESDPDPIVYQSDEGIDLVSANWNPSGTVLAIAGRLHDAPENETNVVCFISPYGEHLRTLRVPGTDIAGCSFEGSGLRIALAVDSHIFFANIRPNYKWGYCGQTVVFSFTRADRTDTGIAFWDTRLDEVHIRFVDQLLAVSCYGDYCIVASKSQLQTDVASPEYSLELCNAIGTTVDSQSIPIEPLYVGLSRSLVVAASREAFYVWTFFVARQNKGESVVALPLAPKRGDMKHKLYHVDDKELSDATQDMKRAYAAIEKLEKTMDPICCLCVTDKYILIARESNTLQQYSLQPTLRLHQTYQLLSRPIRMEINCDYSRIAIINNVGTLSFFDLQQSVTVEDFQRKDVWDLKWDEDNSSMLAIMEKTRLYVIRDLVADEPIVTSGYICHFKDLTVRTALVDDLVAAPENAKQDYLVDIEIQALRDAKQYLETASLKEAAEFIGNKPHRKLWALLADVALRHLDTEMAEHAFVHMKDYDGIQFVKKLRQIQNENLRRAEVASRLGNFEEAESIYLDNDRRDLAIAMRSKLGDWFRVVELLRTGYGPADDAQLETAWNAIGDYYASRQKWTQAAQNYSQGKNNKALMWCYYMMEDYTALENMMRSLDDGHEILPEIGEIFANSGLCSEAVEAYTKSNQIQAALDVCIQLNNWDRASALAKKYDIADVDRLLAKYANELLQDPERQLTAVQLYRKAGQYLEAAKIIYNIAEEQRKAGAKPGYMKKIYVLGALLIEQYHQHTKDQANTGSAKSLEAKAALSGMLDEDVRSTVMDSRLIDNAWRGAEAYHFYLLAQKQLYSGYVDLAMKTAMALTEYDDFIDPVDAYSILALASCANRQFAVCSSAFIRLESLDGLSEQQKDAYQQLALDIFTRNQPKDTKTGKAECTGCETLIPDHSQFCPQCDTKFPTCIISGRPLVDYQFWLCPVCKHRAFEHEVATVKYCSLCHTVI